MYANGYFMKQNHIAPENMTEEQRLLYKLMRNYDRSSRPVYRAQTPVTIRLGISLTQVLDIVSFTNFKGWNFTSTFTDNLRIPIILSKI